MRLAHLFRQSPAALTTPGIAALMLGLPACGGSASAPNPAASTPSAAGHHALVRTYRAALTGAPHGARTGTGAAVIAFHGSSVVCWRFAHLHNFLYATDADIRSGAPDRRSRLVLALTRGPHLHHRGCVEIRPALTHAIERHPHNYTVNIDSARYPAGAIRGPL